MKKAYIQPSVEVVNIGGSDALMESVLNISNTEVNTSDAGVQLGREEEDLSSGPWDAEW